MCGEDEFLVDLKACRLPGKESTMKFECIKCGFGFESSKNLKTYQHFTYPNCGGIILCEEWKDTIKSKLFDSNKDITPEKINELLGSEKDIMEKAGRTVLGTVKNT